ncbi:MAG: peptidylprolyl isomerase [Firmicutes bacterium]|nr:peptidylprolyl isomerase [Bacillota bacterium]
MFRYKKHILILMVAFMLLNVASCVPAHKITIATVDGEKISKEEFIYFLTSVKNQIESEHVKSVKNQTEGEHGSDLPEDFWETTEIDGKKIIETAKEKALEEAVKSKISRKKAIELGLKISSQQRKEINETIGEFVAKHGSSGVDEYLSQFGLNRALFEKVLEDDYYRQNLSQEVVASVGEEQAEEFFNNKIVRVKHILILSMDETTGQPLEAQQLENAKIKADDLLAKAKSGENFDSLVEQYSEDPGSKSMPEGYYLGKGFVLGSQGGMVPSFETASFELDVDEVSDIVETDYGFHIIKRYQNDKAIYQQHADEILAHAKKDKFEEVLDNWKNEAKIEKNEKEYGQIKINK